MGRLWYVPFKKHVDPVSMDKNWTSIEEYLNSLELNEEGAIGGGEKTYTAGAPSGSEGNNGDWRYTDAWIYVKQDGSWVQMFPRYTDAEVDTIVATHDGITDAHHARYTDGEVDTIVATHDAITDAHHAVYTDGEAVTAMGVVDDSNDLNHVKDVWESWIAVDGGIGFENSWANNGGGTDAEYRKHPDGRVALRGLIDTGSISTTAFTLPTGYRPAAKHHISVASNSLYGQVDLNTDGAVDPTVGDNTWVSLDGIRFDSTGGS